jgi:hypothetical protein
MSRQQRLSRRTRRLSALRLISRQNRYNRTNFPSFQNLNHAPFPADIALVAIAASNLYSAAAHCGFCRANMCGLL